MQLPVFSQSCDSFNANTSQRSDRIYIDTYRELSGREIRRQLQSIEKELENELRIEMAEKILIEVTTTTTISITESGTVYQDYFNNETQIQTTANLSHGESEYCLDKRNKILYARYSLNRNETAKAILRDCDNRMQQINNELQSELTLKQGRDLSSILRRKDKVKRDSRMATFLDSSIEQEGLNKLFAAFEKLYGQWVTDLNQGDFNDRFIFAESKIQHQEFESGILLLKRLKLEYPQRNEVPQAIERASKRYETYTHQTIEVLLARKEYSEALKMLNSYCQLISCSESALRTEIRGLYFEQEYDKFNRSVEAQLPAEVEMHFQILKELADADEKTYSKAQKTYDNFQIEKEMRLIEGDMSRHNYLTAFQKANKVSYNYDTEYNDFWNLKKTTEKELLRSEVKKEKQTRRKLFSMAIGLEATTNFESDIEDVDDAHIYVPSYSFGLYKKINYTRYASNGYPRASDIIGIKIKLIDYWNAHAIDANEVPGPAWPHRYDGELALDGTIVQWFHYSAGVVFPDLDWERDPFYTLELGLRLPLGPVSLQGNLRSLLIESDVTYAMHFGVFAHFDFWRKFNVGDRKAIKKKFGI